MSGETGETERVLQEIIAMGSYNPNVDVLAEPVVDMSEHVTILDEGELAAKKQKPAELPTIEVTLDDVVAEPAKPKATPPPTPINNEHPFGRDEIEVAAYFVQRKNPDGTKYRVLSAITVQTADMMTSCGSKYDKLIASGRNYKVSLTMTNRDDGSTQRYSPINPKDVTARIREYMQDGSELDSKIIPITRARGNKLPPPTPADAYNKATTA